MQPFGLFVAGQAGFQSIHPAHQAVLAHKRRTRDYFRQLAEAARLPNPSEISDQWMLLSEGAIITALVEDDRDAAKRAGKAATALLGAAWVGPEGVLVEGGNTWSGRSTTADLYRYPLQVVDEIPRLPIQVRAGVSAAQQPFLPPIQGR
ncbi:MAG TPA: hypothetical protein VK390_07750 [Propionibacteriaceae bacterium]|nr:hypothetical protein [Propionibacteriaceae bacterium]